MSLAAASGSGLPLGAFWVDVDQAHLHGREGIVQLPISVRMAFVGEPLAFRAPVDILLWLPDVFATAGESSVLNPIDSRAQLPAKTMRSAHEILFPYFCLIGQSSRRALSRFALSGQLFRGAKRCVPSLAPPRPSVTRYVPALCQAIRINSGAVVPVVGRPPVL